MLRKLYDQLKRSLREFVNQRDDLLLLVACGDNDVALVLKALRDLDRESATELYLLFANAFQSPDLFLTGIAEHLQQELTVADGMAGPEDEKLSSLPADLLNEKNSPWVRLEAGFQYARSLVDPRLGQRYVWAMGPPVIEDPNAYLKLLAQIPPWPDILPWMRGGRIVARVPVDFSLEQSPLANAKRVHVEPFVIPPNAHEEGLLAAAADPKVPMADRMQAEVQLAYLDYAHSRFDAATERFRKALAFFQWAVVPPMEALIISGLGDIARRQEDWKQAKHWYSCAVVPAAESGNPVLMSNVVQNLAVVAYHDKRYAEAEERYSELITLKRSMFDEDGLAEALEWQGICQEKQNAYDRAVVSWEEAALISKSFDLEHRLEPMLAHLKRGYEHLGLHDELAHFDDEWRS